MFAKLFGSKGPPPRDVRRLAHGLAAPAIHVVKDEGGRLSHFGGDPHLPPGAEWPSRDGKRLAFLARLSVAEMRRAVPIDWLPAAGALLFFYDADEQPWGFEPNERGSWAVLHVPDLAQPAAAGGDGPVPFRAVAFRAIESWPSTERPSIEALGFTGDEAEAYIAMSESVFDGRPGHQVGGFPDNVQSDTMELECQLASHGLYCGDESGYNDPRAAELGPGAADWRLLFQFDTDDEMDVMWGDCGKLYFWVPEAGARAGDFSNAWIVLQCS
jgi:uncharacterized protein YwqG